MCDILYFSLTCFQRCKKFTNRFSENGWIPWRWLEHCSIRGKTACTVQVIRNFFALIPKQSKSFQKEITLEIKATKLEVEFSMFFILRVLRTVLEKKTPIGSESEIIFTDRVRQRKVQLENDPISNRFYCFLRHFLESHGVWNSFKKIKYFSENFFVGSIACFSL